MWPSSLNEGPRLSLCPQYFFDSLQNPLQSFRNTVVDWKISKYFRHHVDLGFHDWYWQSLEMIWVWFCLDSGFHECTAELLEASWEDRHNYLETHSRMFLSLIWLLVYYWTSWIVDLFFQCTVELLQKWRHSSCWREDAALIWTQPSLMKTQLSIVGCIWNAGSRWMFLDASIICNTGLPRDACTAQIKLKICATYHDRWRTYKKTRGLSEVINFNYLQPQTLI